MQPNTSQSATSAAEPYPGDVYGTPENLLAAALTHEEKVRLMQQWAVDLAAKLRASDENMTSNAPNQAGDLLLRVKNAQRMLEGSH